MKALRIRDVRLQPPEAGDHVRIGQARRRGDESLLQRAVEQPVERDPRNVDVVSRGDHGGAIGGQPALPAVNLGGPGETDLLAPPCQIEVGLGQVQVVALDPLQRFGPQHIKKRGRGVERDVQKHDLQLFFEGPLQVPRDLDVGQGPIRVDQLGQRQPAGKRALGLGAEADRRAIFIDPQTRQRRVDLRLEHGTGPPNVLGPRGDASLEGLEGQVGGGRLMDGTGERQLALGLSSDVADQVGLDHDAPARIDGDRLRRGHVDRQSLPLIQHHRQRPRVLSRQDPLDVQGDPPGQAREVCRGSGAGHDAQLDLLLAHEREAGQATFDQTPDQEVELALRQVQRGHVDPLGVVRQGLQRVGCAAPHGHLDQFQAECLRAPVGGVRDLGYRFEEPGVDEDMDLREAGDLGEHLEVTHDAAGGDEVVEVVHAAGALGEWERLGLDVQRPGANGWLRWRPAPDDLVGRQRTEGHDQIDLGVGHQPVDCRADPGDRPIAGKQLVGGKAHVEVTAGQRDRFALDHVAYGRSTFEQGDLFAGLGRLVVDHADGDDPTIVGSLGAVKRIGSLHQQRVEQP